ncbi:hypothetical protein CAEBREN_05593 [Caenorhabditis brenneri]|uniref:Uncharacterized protein n=1 Tax=Caenorhabditis brenneri TaxID=135651 RepID=G0NM12_CAEBE|nr:hypothetical protein CAEBREN_05593 [Caenorhabditis brenneri]
MTSKDGEPKACAPPYRPIRRNLRMTGMARDYTKRKTIFPLIMDMFILFGCVHYFIVDACNPTGTFMAQPIGFPPRHPTKPEIPAVSIGAKFALFVSSGLIHYTVSNGRHRVVKNGTFLMRRLTFMRILMIVFDFYVGASGLIDLGSPTKPFYWVSCINFALEVMFTFCMYKMNKIALRELDILIAAMDDIEEKDLQVTQKCSCGKCLVPDCETCGSIFPDPPEYAA